MNKRKNNNKRRTVTAKRRVSYSKPAKRTKRRVSGFSPAVVAGAKRRRKKRKVKGLTGNPIMDAIAGLAVGTGLAMAATKFIPIENKKARDGIIAALGVGVLMFGAKQKDRFIQGIGSGMTVVGGTQLAQDFGVMPALTGFMSGIGVTEDEDVMFIEMQGLSEQDMMGALAEQDMMSGPNQRIPIVSGHNDMEYDDSRLNNNMNGDMPPVISNVF